MKVVNRLFRSLLPALCVLVFAACVNAQAQTGDQEFTPKVGQQGKDVIWVPTPQELVDKMLDMAQVAAQDYVIDLGSGDGRLVITAAKRGARALGIEYNPDMVELAKRNAAKEGVGDKVQFVKADLFESDFSEATVVTMFLLPEINLKLRPRILDLRPGTRIVSNSFTMGEWTADETETITNDCSGYCTALFWIVPAKVEGTWRLPQGELTLKQNFQQISGTLGSRGNSAPIVGKLRGDEIRFSSRGAEYVGRVSGNAMEGIVRSGGRDSKWSATRK